MPSALVVDDNPLVRALLSRTLEACRCEVVLASTAFEALAAAAKALPSIAVVDAALPGGGGAAVANGLRALPGGAVVPLVALLAPGQGAVDAPFDAPLGAPFEALVELPLDVSPFVRLVQSLLSGERRPGLRLLRDPFGIGVAAALADAFERLPPGEARLSTALSWTLAFTPLRGLAVFWMDPGDAMSLAGLAREGGWAQAAGCFGARDLLRKLDAPALFTRSTHASLLEALEAASGAAFPFGARGSRRGILVLASGDAEPDREALRATGRTLAALLEGELLNDRASGRVLRSIFDALPAGVVVADQASRIVLHNEAARTLLGTPLEGARVAERYVLYREDGVTPYLPQETPLYRAQHGHSVDGELLLVRAKGTPGRWLRASARPLPAGEGGAAGGTVVFTDVTAERDAVEAVKRGQADLRHVIDESPNGVLILRRERIVYANRAILTSLGRPDGVLLGRSLYDLVGEGEAAPLREFLEQAASRFNVVARETRFPLPGGRVARIELVPARLAEYEGGEATLIIVRDVTESRQLEEQLLHAQKMEAVGHLAGGIAHDFNNIIGALLVNAQLVVEQMRDDDPLRVEIDEIRRAGERAAALTHQLLAFSRRQELRPRLLDLNAVIREMSGLLQRVVGDSVAVKAELAPELGTVRADPRQLQQVVLNVAMNAREAMPGGGSLVVRTLEVADPQMGPCVELALEDTGTGMDEPTRARAFEPFFSTKEKRDGAGLGLATAYGIVRQSGGRIDAFSEPGRGTRIVVRLPTVKFTHPEPALEPAQPLAAHGSRELVILLVEDEDNVREAVRRVLTRRGFRVHEAVNQTEAAAIAAREPSLDLVLMDMVLPGASGQEIANQLRASHPAVEILFMSGYSDQAMAQVEPGSSFLQKPFTPEVLLGKILGMLGTSP